LTSDYEGFPAVIVEAMANGIPCISTDCPVGPSDIIQNELNGVIIPMSDDPTIVKSLTDVIKRLLDGSLSFDISLVKQSADKNKPEIVADKWLELMDHRDVR